MKTRRGWLGILVVAVLGAGVAWGGGGLPAGAEDEAPDAAAAEAYGLLVDAHMLRQQGVKHGPVAWVSQEYPPLAADPAEGQAGEAGPIPPGSGELVNHIGLMETSARADDGPSAVATAQAAAVRLLTQSGTPVITADLARAEAHTDCTDDPNATGTVFRNLVINGNPVTDTPAPNTVHDLPMARVILNEQRPAFDGRGIVVNAIHVVSTTTSDPLFRGDVIVAHAMSTVHCEDGRGSTGAESEVKIVKTVSPDTAAPGDEVTYTATISNHADDECLVNRVVDHLPPGFEFVSTAGDLGTTASTADRPGGGVDVSLGTGVSIPAGGTMTQTFVVKVGDAVEAGTYFNNVEVFCANLGEFLKGLDAPVTVGAQTPPTTAPPTTTPPTTAPPPPADPPVTLPDDDRELPATGGGFGALALAGLTGLAGLGVALLGAWAQRAAASKIDL